MFEKYKLYFNVCILKHGAQNVLFHTITEVDETFIKN